ncbi:MAG TPA: NADH-ubiquinone oxidoreductase-F iron-sulfur binding region domain-containing protein [Anaerolineae bacterium]|nr:NADH-ubiquinone oxidoreductase-F iron-sulfur binding region domain-containing protein [Anaerolineae bacterium]
MPEKHIVLGNCGIVSPDDINTYLERDGFKALEKVRRTMTSQEVIEQIKASGLRGRGGAGFPCGQKWELAGKAEDGQRFVICNADEGEVGTFKDRYLLENDPLTLIEGMAIASHAIGAQQAYIYLRQEYHHLLNRLKNAISQVAEEGFLGSLKIDIVEGAGAYICGEESALMESIEGKRGEARHRPPFPSEKGLFGKPTVINNVETLMNIPPIIRHGSEWFKAIGTDGSRGTKVFSVSGDVERPGVYELVLGSELGELVVDLAKAKDVQAVQVGGAAGRLIPESMLDTPLSYETVLGSGAVTVLDHTRDMIDAAYQTIQFFTEESCGKCAPCREGTEAMLEILGRMVKGDGVVEDIEALEDLSEVMRLSSLCGLGQSAPSAVLDSLEHFRNEYEMRIEQSVLLRGQRAVRV